MKKVLLASISGYFDSLAEIPFMFKKADCQVDVLCREDSWLLTNRFHDHWVEVKGYHDDFVDILLQIAKSTPDKYDWIVMLDDATVKLMNERIDSEELFKKILPMTKMGNRVLLSSKLGLSVLCNKYDITTPKFLNYEEIKDITKIAETVDFPLLLKEDFSCGGEGVHYCEDMETLQQEIGKVLSTENLVIQEFIDGEDVGIEALFKDGKLVMYNAAEILTYMYSRFSFTTRRNYYHKEAIKQILEKVGESFGLNGFASIQFMYHRGRDKYYLVEVDCRTNQWMPYSRFTTQNFSDGIRFFLNGTPLKPLLEEKDSKMEVRIFDRDIRRCIKYLDYRGALQWTFNYKGCWKFIPWYDLKLSKRIFKKHLTDLKNKIIKPN
ncbi:MAG: ATP-grasp domain-containing protein [Bacteroidota bacterium]